MLSRLNLTRQLASFDAVNSRLLRRWSSTIYALSTGLSDRGSAIAVIRISGSATLSGLSMIVSDESKFSKIKRNPRNAILSNIHCPETRELIDRGLVLWFPGPNSYTGEDSAELHVHGSRAVVSSILRLLSRLPDFQPAKEGEFTRRALINGKMSLLEAEALPSLISSRTESQRRLALRALDGNVCRLYDEWSSVLLKAIAHLEATIDFGEDELIDEKILSQCKENLCQLRQKVHEFLKNASRISELVKSGVNMAIIGLPNVGKSTLLNKLCQRELSIVSPISGTTRDVIEGLLDIKGWTVRICDTAGLKDTCTDDPIEMEGIKRAKQRAANADLILLVMDGASLINSDALSLAEYIREFSDLLTRDESIIYIINKMDLLNQDSVHRLKSLLPEEKTVVMISCKTEQALDHLVNCIGEKIEKICGDMQLDDIFITERHQTHLKNICDALELSLVNFDHDLAMAAHHLKECVDEISNITGQISTEDILDVIFKEFCIGK